MKLAVFLLIFAFFPFIEKLHSRALAVNPSPEKYITVLRKTASMIEKSGMDKILFEKTKNGSRARIILLHKSGGRETAIPADDISAYQPRFLDHNDANRSIEDFYLLDYLHGSAGIHDIDNDGTDELFYIYEGASEYGLVIMDYIDKKLRITGDINGFVSFFKLKNSIIMLNKHITAGPELLSTNINNYTAFSYKEGKLTRLPELPEPIYTFYYNKFNSGYREHKTGFPSLFFFIYNHKPKFLTDSYIDKMLKPDPASDKKYIGKENVRRLVEKEIQEVSADILKTKYYYYYLIDKLK